MNRIKEEYHPKYWFFLSWWFSFHMRWFESLLRPIYFVSPIYMLMFTFVNQNLNENVLSMFLFFRYSRGVHISIINASRNNFTNNSTPIAIAIIDSSQLKFYKLALTPSQIWNSFNINAPPSYLLRILNPETPCFQNNFFSFPKRPPKSPTGFGFVPLGLALLPLLLVLLLPLLVPLVFSLALSLELG